MLNRFSGILRVRSGGFTRSCHSLDGVVAPPAKRQLLPTMAMGSEMGFLYDAMMVTIQTRDRWVISRSIKWQYQRKCEDTQGNQEPLIWRECVAAIPKVTRKHHRG